MPIKTCFNCGWRDYNPQQCPLIGYHYKEDAKPCCPYWKAEVPKCSRCGQPDPAPYIISNSDGSCKTLCQKCNSKLDTCGMCSKSSTCDYETNPSPLPKAVQKTIQEGNQIAVITVKNDARIEETCAKNCECFDKENKICRREDGYCENYKEGFEK